MAKEIYQVESLEDIVSFFRDAYELPEGVVASVEHYIDPSRNAVVFKFLADNEVDFDAIRARPKGYRLGGLS